MFHFFIAAFASKFASKLFHLGCSLSIDDGIFDATHGCVFVIRSSGLIKFSFFLLEPNQTAALCLNLLVHKHTTPPPQHRYLILFERRKTRKRAAASKEEAPLSHQPRPVQIFVKLLRSTKHGGKPVRHFSLLIKFKAFKKVAGIWFMKGSVCCNDYGINH
jgi:hypothetical protein